MTHVWFERGSKGWRWFYNKGSQTIGPFTSYALLFDDLVSP